MLRLGLVCDFAEESWPSMDLVGDMLFEQLHRCHSDTILAERIRPALQPRATALGNFKSSAAAWNGDRLWNRMVEYPRWLRKQARNYDLFHIVDHSYAHLALALPAGRTVITCHDLDTFRCLTEPAQEPRPLWFRMMTRRILKGLQSARHVVFVSEAVRQEADRLGLISKSRSSLVHNGAECESGTGVDAERAVYRLLGSSAGADELLLLSVGSTIPRKRIDVLLRVFAGILKEFPEARLIRVGGQMTAAQVDLARQLGVTQSIIELPFLDRAVLGAVYRRATLLLQPSAAEGFGLPVAESMAHGCPVVVSDLPVLREVGGDAAMYCRVGDVSGWIQCVTHLLHQRRSDPFFWSGLRSRSIENARRFSWRENSDRMARLYEGIYQEDLRNAASPLREERAVAWGHEQ